MLKNKFILFGIFGLLTISLLVSNYAKQDVVQNTGEYFYPELKSKLASVTEVELDDSVSKLILTKDTVTNTWVAKNKANYPIDFNKLKNLLVGVAELKIIEAKTNNPDNFTLLSLNQIRGDEISGAIKVLAKLDHGDQPVIDLLLGKRSGVHLRDNYLDEIYVRKNNDNQVWLVTGKLPTAFNFANLVIQPLFKMSATEIQSLSIQHPKQERLVLYKDTKESLDYKIGGLPKSQKIKAQYLANMIPATIANLTFDDTVAASTDKTNWQSSSIIKFKTFNKLAVELKVQQQKNLVMIKIVNITNMDNSNKINIKNWNYIFQMQDVENLFKTTKDLV